MGLAAGLACHRGQFLRLPNPERRSILSYRDGRLRRLHEEDQASDSLHLLGPEGFPERDSGVPNLIVPNITPVTRAGVNCPVVPCSYRELNISEGETQTQFTFGSTFLADNLVP